MPTQLQESQAAVLPAILDETNAPSVAVLSRFTGTRMLRGKIELQTRDWAWHFVLDTNPSEICRGSAASYEGARQRLVEALAAVGVPVQLRNDSKPPPRPGGSPTM